MCIYITHKDRRRWDGNGNRDGDDDGYGELWRKWLIVGGGSLRAGWLPNKNG